MKDKKKLLVMGGKPMGASEIVSYAKSMGLYTIVADYLSEQESPAKQIADESWNVSTADLDILEKMALEHEIDGVIAPVHEFNIEMSLKLSERLGLPSYCTLEQWYQTSNKEKFKRMCLDNGIPVAKEYNINTCINNQDECSNIIYPVIIKPVDSSGSRGFSICNNYEELKKGYNNALSFSASKKVLCEEYIRHESVVVYYNINDGEISFAGLHDKYPKKFGNKGSVIAGIHLCPSVYTDSFRSKYDMKIKNMIKNLDLKNGFFWIEIFKSNDQFIFNEFGLRFSGSLTFYPVEYMFGYNQLYQYIDLSIRGGLNELQISNIPTGTQDNLNYCILPIQIKPGLITSIYGIKEVSELKEFIALGQLKHIGDKIEEWGTGQQVFGYLHMVYDTIEKLRISLREAINKIQVIDENGNNMLFTLFDIENDLIRTN